MNEEEKEIRIDIKAIGGSIGRRAIPHKPNVGKNPKDGDGDGFVVDLTTGLDNVPHNPGNLINGSGSADRPMVAGREVRPEIRLSLERLARDTDKPKRRDSSKPEPPKRLKEIKRFLSERDRDPNNQYDGKETNVVERAIADARAGLARAKKEGNEKDIKFHQKRMEDAKASLKKRGMNDEEIESVMNKRTAFEKLFDLTPQEEADQLEDMLNQPQKIDGDIHGNRRRFEEAARRYIRYVRNGGTDSYADWAKRNVRDENGVRLTVPTQGQLEELRRKPTFALLPKPDKKTNNRFDDADSGEIFKRLVESRTFGKKLNRFLRDDAPMSTLPGGFQRGSGETAEAHRKKVQSAYQTFLQNQNEMIDSLKRRGYEDVEDAIREYGRSKRQQKSFSPMDMMSDENMPMNLRIVKDDEDAELEPRQRIMYEFFELIAKKMGKWEQDAGPNGAHYMEEQPFGDKGMKCINCSFFQGGNRCEIVVGEIKPEAICKLWVIRKDLVKE